MMNYKLGEYEVLPNRFLKQKTPTPKGEKIQDYDNLLNPSNQSSSPSTV